MKGIKIEVENEQTMYLYRPHDVISAIAHALYYSANADSEMCIPNCAYEKAEKMFAEWRDETREKKIVKMYRTCKTCKHREMIGSVDCDICSHSLTAINYEEDK